VLVESDKFLNRIGAAYQKYGSSAFTPVFFTLYLNRVHFVLMV